MSDTHDSILSVSEYKPETVIKFTEMHTNKREFLEHLAKFGNSFERAAASLVIEVATTAECGVEA